MNLKHKGGVSVLETLRNFKLCQFYLSHKLFSILKEASLLLFTIQIRTNKSTIVKKSFVVNEEIKSSSRPEIGCKRLTSSNNFTIVKTGTSNVHYYP